MLTKNRGFITAYYEDFNMDYGFWLVFAMVRLIILYLTENNIYFPNTSQT